MRARLVEMLTWAPLVLAGCVGTLTQPGGIGDRRVDAGTGANSKPDGSAPVSPNEAGGNRSIVQARDSGVAARSDAGATTQDAGSPAAADGGDTTPSGPPAPAGPPRLGPPGTWTNATPPDLNIGEFGPQTMMTDPVRPGEFFFASTYNPGFFKSVDFGKTWKKISDFSLIFGCAADPNPKRDPNTPLTFWCGGGYGNGVARSTDGGVTWSNFKPSNKTADTFGNDPYSFAVNPYDSSHVLVGFHGSPGLSESFDGGQTWHDVTGVTNAQGTSNFPYFVDLGNPTGTRQTWLLHSQWGDGDSGGIQRTTDGGRTWKRANPLQHPHGESQIFQAGEGVMYAGGLDGSEGHGVYRSADYGATWSRVNDGTPQNCIYGTDNYIYADYGWATGGEQAQQLQRSPRNKGTSGSWEAYAPDAKLVNGSGHAATSRDPKTGHWVIVISAWKGGVYRYEEP